MSVLLKRCRSTIGLVLCVGLFALSACRRNPAERLTNPLTGGSSNQGPDSWVLYDEEFFTGGGAYAINGLANQELMFGTTLAASSGRKSVYYSWNGGDVVDATLGAQHGFAGFGLLVASDLSEVENVPPLNLSASNYTKLTFYAKGRLSENTLLRVEAPDDNNTVTSAPRLDIPRSALTDTWTQFTLPITTPASFEEVKIFANFIFVYTQPTATTAPGDGGSVFIDRIAYEK